MRFQTNNGKVRQAVIAAGGAGTRIYPGTKAVPKELLPVPRVPALGTTIVEMVAAGIDRIVIVANNGNTALIERLLDRGIEAPKSVRDDAVIRQFEDAIRSASFSVITQMGRYGNGTPLLDATAHGIEVPCVYAFADDVVFGENVSKGLLETFEIAGTAVLAAQAVRASEVQKFGILECGKSGNVSYVKRFIEKPGLSETTSRLASLGRYLITEAVVNALTETRPGRGGEIWLSDAFVRLIELGSRIAAFRLKRGRWHTVGNPDGFAKAVQAGLKAERHALNCLKS